MNDSYFASILNQLAERATNATISDRTPSHAAFRNFLRMKFQQLPGKEGSFLGQPVFESLFEYESQDKTIEELGLLHPRLIQMLDSPPGEHASRRFPKDIYPYKHQVTAWQTLKADPVRSTIVSTGTASGKTECFLIPILDDLVREYEETRQQLAGVRALFLYPLNALINSQRERLKAWTAGMNGNIRFCLYNGATPNQRVSAATAAANPEEIMCRPTLRESPPPILVTNATMLEYMLVRNIDLPIINQSEGLLRWIVLDEAHTYLGSNAAEISLLLRRVIRAFGVNPAHVHFIATSATIGGEGATEKLRQYLADLAGVSPNQVDVIGGRRVTPDLNDQIIEDLPVPKIDELIRLNTYSDRRKRLVSVPEIRKLRHELTEQELTAEQIQERLGVGNDLNDTLALLDFCSEESTDESGEKPLLPLRGHYFMRTQAGVWACWNNGCSGKTESLSDESWPFGSIFFNHLERCPHCDSLVFEVLICRDCGEVYLSAQEDERQSLSATSWTQMSILDEYDIEIDEEMSEDDEDSIQITESTRQLVCSNTDSDYLDATNHYDKRTGNLIMESETTLPVRLASRHAPNNRIRCVTCGETDSTAWQQFRPIRVGAPFYLGVAIPTFLEHAPAKTNQTEPLPRNGRQLITFTDSRQGTARFAGRMQLEAEKNYVRSYIYHKLWSRAETTSQEEVDELRKEVELLNSTPGLESLANQRNDELILKERNLFFPDASISWSELVNDLQTQLPVQRFIPDSTQLRYREALTDPHLIAQMFLYREFIRRPKGGNSTETLGLASLHFPQLDSVQPPDIWTNRNQTGDSWRAYLKMCVDFYIRGSHCSEIPDNLRRWLGMRYQPVFLERPDSNTVRNFCKSWPTINTARRLDQRLIEILRLSLNLNLDSANDRNLIDRLLWQAWEDLVTSRIFNHSNHGYRLRFELSEIRLVSQSYRCPVTQRLIDNVVSGISPYHNERTYQIFGSVTPVEMPQLPFPFLVNKTNGKTISKEEVATWLREDPKVCHARELGVWTEFSDRIAELYGYFETAEHSGQLSKPRLEGLEGRFREGKTNLLSCSTTMEMGIDIGSLTSVAMNNAPPGPANWLQRAGRAGRRDIARASTLTLCRNQPHAQAIFDNTLWPFITPIHVPRVALNSAKIVQRHIQAFLFGHFLAGLNTENAIQLTNAWMFHSDDASPTVCNQFIAWLEDNCNNEDSVQHGISQIVRRSILESDSLRLILDRAISSIRGIASHWTDQFEALRRELDLVGGVIEPNNRRTAQPEQRALMLQLRRLEGEYLLKELASEGFLPAHGFPLNVLPFVNTSIEQLMSEQNQTNEDREDNLFQTRSYPSRQLAMAIREYAPGNSVMIDGLSYISSGLTLHWQVPPNDIEFREAQAILGYWRCENCGFSESSAVEPENCEICQSPMIGERYIKPSGFAVDIRTGRPNSNEDDVIYVPPTEPRLTCRGDWISLPNPILGRFRFDSQGKIFHRSKGASGFGYAICLRCGRAASENGSADESPVPFMDENGEHWRLRSGRRSDNSRICPGSHGEFTIQRNLMLGGEENTDVFQLRLYHPNREEEALPEEAAVTIAIALRTALSQKLGIEDQEIGWAVQNNREAGVTYRDIYLYDVAAGGAGYVASAGEYIDSILHKARQILCCECDKACHACLLDFSTQRYADLLDRNAALEWLDDDFFIFLQVPDQFRVLGETTVYEPRSITEAMLLEMQSSGLREITVYLNGDVELWDIDSLPLWRHLAKLSTSDTSVQIKVILPESVRKDLSWHTLHSLVLKAAGREITVEVIPDGEHKINDCLIAATITSTTQTVTWGVFDSGSLLPGAEWGVGAPDWPIIKSKSIFITITGEELTLDKIYAERPEDCTQLLISSELDGQISDVGSKFWEQLINSSSLLRECIDSSQLVTIAYTDRYIRSPLHARVLYEILKPYGNNSKNEKVTLEVRTVSAYNSNPARYLHHNWPNERDQKGVIQSLFKDEFDVKVSVYRHTSQLRHARFLCLSWSNGQRLDINIDQGVGFFKTRQSVSHNFTLSARDQANQIRNIKFNVHHDGDDMPTYVIRGAEEI